MWTQKKQRFFRRGYLAGEIPLPFHDNEIFRRSPKVSENIVRIIWRNNVGQGDLCIPLPLYKLYCALAVGQPAYRIQNIFDLLYLHPGISLLTYPDYPGLFLFGIFRLGHIRGETASGQTATDIGAEFFCPLQIFHDLSQIALAALRVSLPDQGGGISSSRLSYGSISLAKSLLIEYLPSVPPTPR